jgi:hypothetical protein
MGAFESGAKNGKNRQFDLARKADAVQDKLTGANVLILR